MPITLSEFEHRDALAAAETGEPLTVDLEAQNVRLPGGQALPFQIDPHRRRALLLGLDQIGAILADDATEIADFESRQRSEFPWLYLDRRKLSHFDNLGIKVRNNEQA